MPSSPWPKRIGVGVVAILAAVAAFFAVRHFRSPARIAEPVATAPEDRIAKEFEDAFGPVDLIPEETK